MKRQVVIQPITADEEIKHLAVDYGRRAQGIWAQLET